MSDASVGRRLAPVDGPAGSAAADVGRWDLAIIGAGPAGSVCAYCALMACPDLRVALVDRETFPRDKACGDAVREEAMLTLSELGLGAPFAGRPPVPRRQATVPRRFTYMKQMLKGNNPIYVVERQVLDHHLFEAAIDRGAVDFSGHKLTDASVDENGGDWVLALKQSSGATVEVRCATLVGADGAGSQVRRIAGLELSGDRYTSVALRGYARVEGSAARAMRFDFLESVLPGYGWTFPLTGNAVNVGVIIDRTIYKLAGRSLKSYLEEYVRWLRGEGVALTDLGSVMAHPLPLGSELPPLTPRPGLALIGDAGSMIHPFTGEGIHFAIWAGRELGTRLGRCVEQGTPVQVGLESFAEAYAKRFTRTMKGAGGAVDHIRIRKLCG